MPPNKQKGAALKNAAAIRIAKQNARISAQQAAHPPQLNPNFENKPSGKSVDSPIPPRIKSWDEKDVDTSEELFHVIKKSIHDGRITLGEIIESEMCEEATIERETRRLIMTIVKNGKKILLKIRDAEIFKQACSVMGVTDIEHLPTEPETYMETPQPPADLSGEAAFLALDEDPTPEGEDIFQQERSVAREMLGLPEEEFDTLEQPSTIPIQGKSGLEMVVEELDKRVTLLEELVGKRPSPIASDFVVIESQPEQMDLDEVTLIAVKEMDGKFSKKKLSDELLIQFPTCSNIVIDTAIKKALFRFRKDKK